MALPTSPLSTLSTCESVTAHTAAPSPCLGGYVVGMPVSSSVTTIPVLAIGPVALGPDLVTVLPPISQTAMDCITMDLSSNYRPVPDRGYCHCT